MVGILWINIIKSVIYLVYPPKLPVFSTGRFDCAAKNCLWITRWIIIIFPLSAAGFKQANAAFNILPTGDLNNFFHFLGYSCGYFRFFRQPTALATLPPYYIEVIILYFLVDNNSAVDIFLRQNCRFKKFSVFKTVENLLIQKKPSQRLVRKDFLLYYII